MHSLLWKSSFAVLVAIVPMGCGEVETQGPEPQPTTVRLVEAERATLQETARAVGTLRSTSTAELQAEAAGRVEQVHFEEGASVEQGELLFTLRDDLLRARLQARRAALSAARARSRQAARALERREPLAGTGAISQEELTTTRSELSQAEAEVEELTAELGEIREELADTRIVAPFGGRLSQRLVDPGDYLQVGEQVATLYRSDALEVELRLPERLARRARVGQQVSVVPAGSPELAFDARVTFVSPAVEVSGRDLVVKAAPDPHAKVPPGVTPGMSVTGKLVLETRRDRSVLPAEALVGGREGYSIFVVNNGTAHRRRVKIGLRQPGLVEIIDGVRPGERVVREGHMRLSEGAPVRALQTAADAGEAS